MMKKLKEKLFNTWTWIRQRIIKVLIALGIVGIAVAVILVMLPDGEVPYIDSHEEIILGGDSWYNSNWSNKFSLTTSSTLVDGNLTNYPAYYDCANAPAGFWTIVKGDGSDIRITSSSQIGTLNHELVAISTSSQTCEIHFDTVSISSTTGTVFYLYYGNAGANDTSTSTTWNSNYIYVSHLQNNPATASTTDSTSNGNDGHSVGNPQDVAGKIGQGHDFDGTGDWVVIADSASLGLSGTALTVQMWINLQSQQAENNGLFHKGFNAEYGFIKDKDDHSVWFVVNTDATDTSLGAGASDTALTVGTWELIHGVYDGSNSYVYEDGSVFLSQAASGNMVDAANDLTLAVRENQATEEVDAYFDEIRILDVALSSGWIKTEYNNQSSSTAFWVAGAEELLAVARRIITVE